MFQFNEKRYDIERLDGDCYFDEKLNELVFSSEFLQAIQEFADSDLPNSFFLQHLNDSCPLIFREKRFWIGFAKVLTTRGYEKIKDDAEAMLMWLQDINWPGNCVVIPFVRKNFAFFRKTILQCITRAWYSNDTAWANALLTLYQEETGMSEDQAFAWMNQAENASNVFAESILAIMQELEKFDKNAKANK